MVFFVYDMVTCFDLANMMFSDVLTPFRLFLALLRIFGSFSEIRVNFPFPGLWLLSHYFIAAESLLYSCWMSLLVSCPPILPARNSDSITGMNKPGWINNIRLAEWPYVVRIELATCASVRTKSISSSLPKQGRRHLSSHQSLLPGTMRIPGCQPSLLCFINFRKIVLGCESICHGITVFYVT